MPCRLWQADLVEKDSLVLLADRLPSVKESWLPLLADEPSDTPLGRHETVTFLMDATFIQLMHDLEIEDETPARMSRVTVVAPLHLYLACGLRAVKKYFTTGEKALRAGAAEVLGEDFKNVEVAFRRLVQHEIEALCLACEHSALPSCELRKTAPPDSNSRP